MIINVLAADQKFISSDGHGPDALSEVCVKAQKELPFLRVAFYLISRREEYFVLNGACK